MHRQYMYAVTHVHQPLLPVTATRVDICRGSNELGAIEIPPCILPDLGCGYVGGCCAAGFICHIFEGHILVCAARGCIIKEFE